MDKLVIKSEEKRLVYGEVYSPLHVDTDGEAMTADAIEKMAHSFISSGLTDKIDISHNGKESGIKVVESFIARKGDPDGFVGGAWVLGCKVAPDALWAKVKSGELNGFSFKGQASQRKVRASVKLTRKIEGETEPSLAGLLPPHKHGLVLTFSERGTLNPGVTNFNLGHQHSVERATATEKEMDHSHRLVLMRGD